jgi:DNA-binding response OmpR family regulator
VNILLLEPDSILGATYQRALEQAGHVVAWSRNAEEAVDLVDRDAVDVVILELQLPGHGGIEFLYEFRSYPEWQSVPVILHTFVPPRDVVIPMGLNVAAHAYKPETSLKQLVGYVSEALPISP